MTNLKGFESKGLVRVFELGRAQERLSAVVLKSYVVAGWYKQQKTSRNLLGGLLVGGRDE